jgi:hypothetical protein
MSRLRKLLSFLAVGLLENRIARNGRFLGKVRLGKASLEKLIFDNERWSTGLYCVLVACHLKISLHCHIFGTAGEIGAT